MFPGLLLLSAATLLLELALTRVLSVALWYHFAFMAVSTALFGFGFAGVFLSLRREPGSITPRFVALAALSTPVTFALGYRLFNLVPFEPFALGTEPVQWLWLPLAYLAISLPFFTSGLAIAALLTRYAHAVHRLYLFDLLGAGAGSLLIVALLPSLGGSGTVLAAAALAAAGAGLLAWQPGRRLAFASFALGLGLAALVPFADRLAPLRISRNKTLRGARVERLISDPRLNLFTAWNTVSRIDVLQGPEGRVVLIDAGTALTRIVHPERPVSEVGGVDNEEAFFVQLFQAPRVLVIGSGGGPEVLRDLRAGASHVTGVEINPAINRLVEETMADYAGHLFQDPRVTIVTDEARSQLRRSTERFQVIHCPHTISNSALASGSLSLAENHLMTLEAFEDYLDHLTDDGVLVITRPEAHLPRLFATARAVAEARSERDLSSRVIAWHERGPGLSFEAGFALRRRPFTPEEVEAFRALLARRNLAPLYLPGGPSVEPYPSILTAADPRAVQVGFSALLEPATDDKPFFNRRVAFSQIRWSDVAGVFSRGSESRVALEDRPVAEAALLVLLVQAALLALVFIVLPLVVFRRRALAGRGRVRTLCAFGALGLGYLVIEVGFIQRFTLFLGKPAVLFATVLGSLLVSSGLGSAFSRRFTGSQAPWRACAAAGAIAAASCLLAVPTVRAALGWPEGARVALAMLFVCPAGFVMGMPFPLLVRRLEASGPERIPWAWGLNAFASVVGSIGAILLGMTAGYTAILWLGVACYGVAALAADRQRAPVIAD